MRLTQGLGAVAMVCTDCGHSTTVEAFVELTEQRCRELEDAGDAIVRALKRTLKGEWGVQFPPLMERWEGLRKTPEVSRELDCTPGAIGLQSDDERNRLSRLVELLMRWHGNSIDRNMLLEGLDELR